MHVLPSAVVVGTSKLQLSILRACDMLPNGLRLFRFNFRINERKWLHFGWMARLQFSKIKSLKKTKKKKISNGLLFCMFIFYMLSVVVVAVVFACFVSSTDPQSIPSCVRIMECVQKLGLKSQLLFSWAGVTKTISNRNFQCHNTLKCRVWCELVSCGLSQKSAWKSDFYQCKQFVVCHMIQYNTFFAGESGLGKSTLINSMFLSEIYSNEYPGPSHRVKKTVQVSCTPHR